MQAGYSHRLGSRGKAMTAFDVQWFGDNGLFEDQRFAIRVLTIF